MVIGAHPDDELLGAGGTLARHVLAGDEVHAIVVADGARSRYPAELAAALEKQARRAAEVIGFASLQLLSLLTSGSIRLPLIELTQRLEGVLDEIEPGIVYTHFPEDVNADHGLVARCAWTACRPYARPQVRKVRSLGNAVVYRVGVADAGDGVPAQPVRRRDGHARRPRSRPWNATRRSSGLPASALAAGRSGSVPPTGEAIAAELPLNRSRSCER